MYYYHATTYIHNDWRISSLQNVLFQSGFTDKFWPHSQFREYFVFSTHYVAIHNKAYIYGVSETKQIFWVFNLELQSTFIRYLIC